ncbi:MAG: ABC transporter permease [Mobilicoccus sp.]|nr:ABC transporter permease [Mobilicoccus sp.]
MRDRLRARSKTTDEGRQGAAEEGSTTSSRAPRFDEPDVLYTHEFTEDPYDARTEDGELAGDDVAAGLDALEADQRPRRFDPWIVLAPIIAVISLLLIWQGAVWLEVRPPWVLPGPLDVWAALTTGLGWEAAGSAVWTSLSRGLVGFVMAVAIGTLVGLLVGQVRGLRLAFKPLLVAMQSLPSVAWVPAAILWFGLTDTTMYAVILLGAVPSIAMGLIGGIDQTPPLLTRAGRVLGANRLQLIRHVLLPAALPTYLTGIKQGWAFSWRSLMAAEIIVRSPQLGLGLGHLLNQGRDLSDVSLVMVAVLLVLIVGIVMDVLVFSPLEKHVLRRRGLGT